MNEEETALSKRLVQCEEWRWKEGMLVRAIGGRTGKEYVHRLDASEEAEQHVYYGGLAHERFYPDLHDWATVGCLLGMVVEAVRLPSLLQNSCQGNPTGWIARGLDTPLGAGVASHPGPALARLLVEVRDG
jgi:hypothetical protein